MKKGTEKTVMKQPSASRHPSFCGFHVSNSPQALPSGRLLFSERVDWVILKLGGKKWEVKLNRRGGKWRYTKFSASWNKFAEENSLELGDECTFELLKMDHVLVFNVTVVHGLMCL
ncbi:unnamed protein product [Linum trigynum]|uniref:TF-B3 domain-containing protein n=1 Tax=Linum trigynum TaxID=586398 RepID=A0AAV2EM42_9ROSI